MNKTRLAIAVLSVLSLAAVPAFARPHDGDRDGGDDRDRDRSWRHHQGPAVVVDQGDTLGDIDHALQELQSLSDKVGDVRDRRLRDELRDRISRLERDLQDERDDVADARPTDDRPPEPPQVVVAPPPVGPQPMSDARFQEVRDAIAQAYYTPQKYAVIQSVARDNFFTVDQVVVVMNDLYWNNDKVKAAAMLYPKVLDKQNWFKAYGALYFDSDKDALRRQTEEAMR